MSEAAAPLPKRSGLKRWGTVKNALEEGKQDACTESIKQLTAAIRDSEVGDGEHTFSEKYGIEGDENNSWHGIKRRTRRASIVNRLNQTHSFESALRSVEHSALALNGFNFDDDPSAQHTSATSGWRLPNARQNSKRQRPERPDLLCTPAGMATAARSCLERVREWRDDFMRARNEPRDYPWYLIDPATSFYIKPLDSMGIVALIFTALVTPFEVAFLRPPTSVDALFVLNRLVDTAFIIDMTAQFFIIVQVHDGNDGLKQVTSQRSIAWRYITGWFPLDLFATALSVLDIVSLLDQSSAQSVSQLKVLRVIRVLRLIKLIRLTRASRLIERWETRVSINYAVLSLVRITLVVVLYLHWSACVWGTQLALQGGDSGYNLADTWVGSGRYCVVSAIIATPGNSVEQAFSVMLMLAGGTVWAQVTGVFCGVLSTMSPNVTAFRITMDNLNAFMAKMHFSSDLRWRLRQFFHRSRHVQDASSSNLLMLKMSPSLQGEVLWRVNHKWLRRVRFLQRTQPEFIAKVLLSLRPLVFAPSEVVFGNQLYILHHGVAIYGGKVMTAGGVWGEDMLMQNETLRSRFHAKALNYVEVFCIDRTTLLDIAEQFPDSHRLIKKYVALLAVRRMVTHIAKQELLMRQQLGLTEEERSPILLRFFALAEGELANAAMLQTRSLDPLNATGSQADGSYQPLASRIGTGACSSLGACAPGTTGAQIGAPARPRADSRSLPSADNGRRPPAALGGGLSALTGASHTRADDDVAPRPDFSPSSPFSDRQRYATSGHTNGRRATLSTTVGALRADLAEQRRQMAEQGQALNAVIAELQKLTAAKVAPAKGLSRLDA